MCKQAPFLKPVLVMPLTTSCYLVLKKAMKPCLCSVGEEFDAESESTERGIDSGKGNLLVLLKSFVASVFLSLFPLCGFCLGKTNQERFHLSEYLTDVWKEKVRWLSDLQGHESTQNPICHCSDSIVLLSSVKSHL